ncbi:hypothetical protein QBC46DRAFT_285876 [Diplogelasinospora grovesii]|uniref:Arf-GAP domain-containing protein n=1 Tax=Diplogelasinospora grovesii TaxID=303347 RepID=A0AAN6NA95_9PEZI|nr:hypothetical protein QBC46DRAFT_285876 [Diplogelasinospora grovesii]
MSRRPPNPAAERAAQNQQTIKSLLKLEANKVCADCKRNKHPRWASWNLGVFVCIRCSGIHRGMGTHISRVKSVDLDSWTDEQLQSVLTWGNARANKYWEAKLAPGHVPSEAKIENFIRTKYELKRWVMDGPMPDPATLDADGDDDIPLSVVKEKQNIERRESVRKASVGKTAAPPGRSAGIAAPPQADLIGGDPVAAPLRASTTGPTKVASKAEPAPPKTTSTKDSLLGLDFFGAETAAPPRPASTTGTPQGGGQSRPDLKQSILSLYATAPRPQPAQQVSHAPSGSFGGMPSPTGMAQTQQSSAFGGLNDAFSSLSFASPPAAQKSPQVDAFSSLGSFSPKPAAAAPQSNSAAFSGLSGGSFFSSKPMPSAAPAHQPKQPSFGGFGDFTSAAPAPSKPAPQPASSALGDLFDFSSSSPPRAAHATSSFAPIKPTVSSPPAATNSVFNLSAPAQAPKPTPATTTTSLAADPWASNTADVWGGNAWATPEAPKKSPEVPKPAPASIPLSNDFGWGSSSATTSGLGSGGLGSLASQPIVLGASGGPKVAADEEFGGWASSTTPSAGTGGAKPAAGFGASEDLFSNVWQ